MERDQAIKFMLDLLRLMRQKNASDLFITVGFPPAMKIDGKITPLSKQALTPDNAKALTYCIMNDRQLKEYEATKECNFAVSPPGIGRYRCNAFIQQGQPGLVMRTINTEVPDIDKIGLPEVLKDIIMTKNGLVLMVGGTGSGKSTSLAAMIDYRNRNSYGHIITLEDPVEYVHPHKNCVIMQREVGVDTENWSIALKNSLRQAPDVILLGEIRDQETMGYGIQFSETGHLAMATLHANNTNQALDRIINFFPEERKQQLLMDLSANMRAIISQRLIKRRDGQGRVPAIEILLNTPLIQDVILKGELEAIKGIMQRSQELGMQTFDQSLFNLYESDLITYDDAMRFADSQNELRLRIKLEGKASKGRDTMAGLDHLALEETREQSGHIGR
jgi:twitching motility protein PilU